MLGIGKAHFDREKFEPAMALFDGLLKDYPKSDAARGGLSSGSVPIQEHP